MFKNKNALPRSESHFASEDWDGLAGPGQRHADVTWHVVGTFIGVLEPWSIFWNKFFKKSFQIPPRTRIGIFHQQQTCRGVLNENGNCPVTHLARTDDFCHFAGDLIRPFSTGSDGKFGGVDFHVTSQQKSIFRARFRSPSRGALLTGSPR